MSLRVSVLMACVALGAAAGPAAAGAFAKCDPPRTIADAIAAADRVLVVQATGPTRKRAHDVLTTRVSVVQVLRGVPIRGRVLLDDCADWKCAAHRWKKGERAIVFVTDLGAARFAVMGPPCQGGFTAAVVPDDGKDADAKAIRAALTPPVPRSPAPGPRSPAPVPAR